MTSAGNLALARDLGADRALDYRADAVSEPFDVILDVPGLFPDALSRLAPAGLDDMLGAVLRPKRKKAHRICAGIVRETAQALSRLIALHHAGGYRPLIGEVFPLPEIARAHACADSGHKRGNLVVTIHSEPLA